jgi:uncharacterized membrane protein
MSQDRSDDDAEDDPAQAEVAAVAAESHEDLLALVPHYYRGEVSQLTTGQDRIDRTTDWAVALLTAVLSVVFASQSIPAYLLVIGLLALWTFLAFEVRRYRFYDLSRARVRLIEENVFANAFEAAGAQHEDWRAELADDLREPTFKVTVLEALSRRVKRVYGWLFTVVIAAWALKVTLFTPVDDWQTAASLPGIPGEVVAVLLGVFLVFLVALALWPFEREAKGEVHGVESGEWKD